MWMTRLRLGSGIVLFLYVLGHYLNHAVGIVSVDLSVAAQAIFTAPWKTVPGLILLIGSGLTHMGLAMVALARRRTLRMSAMEVTQYLAGLAIPVIMAEHVSLGLIGSLVDGTSVNFFDVDLLHWVIFPSKAYTTIGAIFVVWLHACIGIHFNLKLKPWYPRIAPFLLVAAVLIPVLSVAGHVAGGMAAAARVQDIEEARMALAEAGVTAEIWGLVKARGHWLSGSVGAVIAAVLLYRMVRNAVLRGGPMLRLAGSGGRALPVDPGATVLEVLRDHGVPHASVCGGRGRCTTCRVKVVDGAESLPKPHAGEASALHRIEAEEGVRLACQLRPTADLSVLPLLPPGVTARQGRQKAHLAGREQTVACLFIDLRGSTRLGESRLPYDVLFILNQFFAEMEAALTAHRGHYATFTGDGLMALFGLSGGEEAACADAWGCGCDMLGRVDRLNAALAEELPFPLRIGVGIHFGVAIVGDIGPPAVRHVSAIGDTINTTARLESMTKDLEVPMVISAAAAERAGLTPPPETRREVEVRGRVGTLAVYALSKETIAALRGAEAAP